MSNFERNLSQQPRRSASSVDIVIPATTLSGMLLACLLLPVALPLPDPIGGTVLNAGLPPLSPGHILGTDLNGNDVLSRILHGGRASILLAGGANLIGLLFGALLGAVCGYRGGLIDSFFMRVLDGFIAFPSLVLVLAFSQTFDSSYVGTILALTIFTVPAFARVARSASLRLRQQSFIVFASLSNTALWRVLVLHIGPNILPQLLTFMFLSLGLTVIIEGALSYLGLGVPAPAPSWGNMIQHGQQALSSAPVLVMIPSACLFITVLSCNLLGDALRTRWSAQ